MLVELQIIALADSSSRPGCYVIILEDIEQHRRLPIIIGAFEAQAIAMALEKMELQRPMTHDLMINTLEGLAATLKEVHVTHVHEGIFYAQLLLHPLSGEPLEVDARPSDAIALAIRSGCPILASEQVMEKAAVHLRGDSKIFVDKRGTLDMYSMEELQQILERLLLKEDYESAARVRDALSKRTKRS